MESRAHQTIEAVQQDLEEGDRSWEKAMNWKMKEQIPKYDQKRQSGDGITTLSLFSDTAFIHPTTDAAIRYGFYMMENAI